MFNDTFDKITWLLLAVVVAALAVLLAAGRGAGDGKAAGLDKAAERAMAYRARVELINSLYGPVEELRKAGKNQEALLRLDGLIRKYPGEAHGHILQGEILREMGALDQAVASFEAGVKLNGDYVDARSPLSRRGVIEGLVAEGEKVIGGRAAANPGNRSLAASLRKVSYLKSRLAGGCE
uniref:TPR domain protein n=1 Tax=Geobacter metallireducens TaxID=28232 RepID=A0A831U347_GEOME